MEQDKEVTRYIVYENGKQLSEIFEKEIDVKRYIINKLRQNRKNSYSWLPMIMTIWDFDTNKKVA